MANNNVNTTELLQLLEITPADHGLQNSPKDVLMDLKTIIDETVFEISDMPLEHRGGYLHRHVTRVDTSPGMIRQMLLERVWAKGIGRLNALYGETEPMAVEKALSELVRQNAVKEKIICKKNSFRIQLANGQYRAYRNGDKGWACPWPTERPYEIHMGGNQFAEFILLFDAEIPEMLARIPAIVDAIRARNWTSAGT